MHIALKTFLARLLRRGTLTVTDAVGRAHTFGDGTGFPFRIRITDPRAEWQIALDPTLRFGEAYMDGTVTIERGDLYDFLEFVYDAGGRVGQRAVSARAFEALRFVGRRFRQLNFRRVSARNVAHHYDISNDLYRAFLDEDMQYSCAYFEREGISLDEAQRAKKRHLAAKLLVRPGDRVLDIGSGWGGFGLYLSQVAGAGSVTGVTLSAEQLRVAQERARRADLGPDRIRFLMKDYRDLSGIYDRIISVGMFEHVGINQFKTFFGRSARLLAPDGVMMLHAIGRSTPPGSTNAFIDKYIFPGGYIPSLSEVFPAIERSGLVVTDVEIWRLHYAETLRQWRQRFTTRTDDLRRPPDARFRRMWEYYLVISELAFRRLGMMVFQIQLARDQAAVPLTRGYIASHTASLRAREAALDTRPETRQPAHRQAAARDFATE